MTDEHKHWSDYLAEKVIKEKKEPYVVSSGMTTSGPAHFGTVCEFLFPYTIAQKIKNKGKRIRVLMVADILDAFDNVPLPMKEYEEQLKAHLGKPLCDVPDPTEKSKSFGDHYLDEVRELIKKLDAKIEIIRANDAYKEGKFDKWAKFYLENEEKAKEIIEKTSGRQLPKSFSVIMPICKNCGKIATTTVISHDSESYEYICDKDVKYTKGCGFTGKDKISNHNYKIVWRLHWPAWKQIFGTSIEGAGVDHNTKGGSEDTCHSITKDLIKGEYHIPYRYGFVLLQGQKYSKSKGLGMGVTEILEYVPPEILKYALLKPDLQENIDFNPTPENLLKIIEEFEDISQKTEELSRADEKKKVAFELSTNRMRWKTPFLDILLYYQIYGFERTKEALDDPQGIEFLKPYITKWIETNFIPEDYKFKYQPKKVAGKLAEFIKNLNENMNPLDIHNAVFEFAKANGIQAKELFRQIYLTLIGKEKGPRIGKLIFAIGVKKVKEDIL